MIKRWRIVAMLAAAVLFFSIGTLPVSASTISMWNSGGVPWDWSRIKITANYFSADANGDVVFLVDGGGDNTSLGYLGSSGTTFGPPVQKWASGAGNWGWNRSEMISGNFINNDAYRDIVIFYDYGGANTGLWLFEGTGAVLSPPGFIAPVLKWNSGPGNWEWNRSKIVAGKFNFDAVTDVAVLYDYGGAATGLWIFPGSSTGNFGAPYQVWNSGPGNWDWNRSQLTATDNDNDGLDELIVLYDYGGSNTGLWVIQPTTGTPTRVWLSGPGNWDWNRSKVVGLLWTAGSGDVAVLYDYGGAATGLWIFSGPSLNSPFQYWNSGPGNWEWDRSEMTTTDPNGNGFDDVIIFYDYGGSTSGLWGIF